jgi:hypothetical protein
VRAVGRHKWPTQNISQLQVLHGYHAPTSAKLERLGPAEEEGARVAASATSALELSAKERANVWDCRHCTKTRMDTGALRSHCEQT